VTDRLAAAQTGACHFVLRLLATYSSLVLALALLMGCISLGVSYVLGLLVRRFQGSQSDAFLAASTMLGLPVAVAGACTIVGISVGARSTSAPLTCAGGGALSD